MSRLNRFIYPSGFALASISAVNDFTAHRQREGSKDSISIRDHHMWIRFVVHQTRVSSLIPFWTISIPPTGPACPAIIILSMSISRCNSPLSLIPCNHLLEFYRWLHAQTGKPCPQPWHKSLPRAWKVATWFPGITTTVHTYPLSKPWRTTPIFFC